MQPQDNQHTETTERILDAVALQDTRTHTLRTFLILAGGALAAAIVLMLILMSLAQNSLPGETLYSFKTNVAEEVTALTKFNTTAKAAYATTRLEHRLTELKILAADNATSSPEHLSTVAALSAAHANTVMGAVGSSEALSPEEKITALANLLNIARAQETLTDEAVEFAPISEAINTLEGSADDTLREAVFTFASTSDAAVVSAFAQVHIADISEALPDLTQGSRAQTLTIRRVTDANEAIIDGDMADAIIYLLKAKEAIAVDRVLYDTERGFIEGQSKEAGEMPEGS